MPTIYKRIIHEYPESYDAQMITLDAYCSNLNARLVSALDALDELQRRHHSEVDQLYQRINALQARSRVLRTRTKLAEAERDVLKEGVDRLLEKVETANDYRALPHSSQIHLPYPLDPINAGPCLISQQMPPSDCHEALVGALIATLTAQLTASKAEFTELKCASDARVAILEARVARREAELQAYRPCPCSCHPHGPSETAFHMRPPASTEDKSHATAAGSLEQQTPVPFSKDQAVKILRETTLRHRILQAEVEGLARKLNFARSAAEKERSTDNKVPIIKHVRDDFSKSDHMARTIDPKSFHSQGAAITLGTISSHSQQSFTLEQDTIDLRAEQDNIAAVLNEDNRLKGVLLIEEECLRLRKSERTLRQQLLLASTAERDLRALVEKLQRKVACCLHDSAPRRDRKNELEIKNGNDPTIVPMTAGDNNVKWFTHSYTYEPGASMMPLPMPEAAHRRAIPDTVSAPHDIQAARLAQIESDFKDARADVQSKERAINSLKTQLAALKQTIALRPEG